MTEKWRQSIERLKASGHYSRAAAKGARANIEKNGLAIQAKAGRAGGKATLAKHGREHFQRMGLKKNQMYRPEADAGR